METITVKPRNKKELNKIKIALKLVDANFEIDKIKLNDFQKKAIDEALEDVANGRVFSHEEVMIERKKLYPHLFNK
jgi:predicted transcriptional regulator